MENFKIRFKPLAPTVAKALICTMRVHLDGAEGELLRRDDVLSQSLQLIDAQIFPGLTTNMQAVRRHCSSDEQ